jgi:hypothetical protein
MAELKTRPTRASVKSFIDGVEDPQKRKDCREVQRIMTRVTGNRPKMWGDSIVGFGSYTYVYPTGRTGDWLLTGFSPRKQNLTLYIMAGFSRYERLLKKLGKHKTGKSCLYIKKLEDVDRDVLEELISESVKHLRKEYG